LALLSSFGAASSRGFGNIDRSYIPLDFVATGSAGTITITNNGSIGVTAFKTAGSAVWDSHIYCTVPFNAPCTVEFTKLALSTDGGTAYSMLGWSLNPTANASYQTVTSASYPYITTGYQVYSTGALLGTFGAWNPALRFYLSYGLDGFVRHYNGATLLASHNVGVDRTFYIDSSFYSVNGTYGGFSDIRAIRKIWNGTTYV
jgi:hypothetical protein